MRVRRGGGRTDLEAAISLAERGGSEAEVEAALRRALSADDRRVAPVAGLYLAALLGDQGRLSEAEDAYRQVEASGDIDWTPHAAYGLARLFVGQRGRHEEAENAFWRAIDSGHPEVAPQAAFDLATLLLEPSGRLEDAAAFLGAVADSHHPDLAPAARRHLDGLLPAASTLGLPSVVFDDRTWFLATGESAGPLVIEEYLPPGQTLDAWEEMVTAVAVRGEVTPRQYMEQVWSRVERRVVDGTLSWTVIDESVGELVYGWELAGDAASVDQLDRCRAYRAHDALHAIHYAARGPLAQTVHRADEWLPRLQASLTEQRAPRLRMPGEPAGVRREAEHLFQVLQRPEPALGPEEQLRRTYDLLACTPRAAARDLWATLQVLLGAQLLEADDPDAAVSALRRSLEVFEPESSLNLWAQASLNLARAFRRVAEARNEASARGHSIALYRQLLRHLSAGELEWAVAMLELGDATAPARRDEAAALYTELISVMENRSAGPVEDPTGLDIDPQSQVIAEAMQRLIQIDREREGEFILPAGYLDRPPRWTALYLRPLATAGELLVRNRFTASALDIAFKDDPPSELPLETVLYLALAREVKFISLGGRQEGHGMARFVMSRGGANWRGGLEVLFTTSDLVITVPHASAGVSWEIGFLKSHAAVSRTLFVMPPESTSFDVAEMWRSASSMMAAHGLHLPRYDRRGLLFRLGDDGTPSDVWPFEQVWTGEIRGRITDVLLQGLVETRHGEEEGRWTS